MAENEKTTKFRESRYGRRITIHAPNELAERIDKAARHKMTSASEVIRQAVLAALDCDQPPQRAA
jgi:metal-responsive CopG/Arc/MetJ family transcriptional regulator